MKHSKWLCRCRLRISSPGYPVDVPPIIYILFVFAAVYRSFYLFIFCAVSVMLCCSSYRRKEHHTLHEFLQTTTKDVMWKGGEGGHTIGPARANHLPRNTTSKQAPDLCKDRKRRTSLLKNFVASGNSAAATMIQWLWHHVIQQQPQRFCDCGISQFSSSHNDSVAVASSNSAACQR